MRENQQSGETDGEKQSAYGNAEKWYAKNSNWVATKALISLALLRRCKKIDDMQYLYTAKENYCNDLLTTQSLSPYTSSKLSGFTLFVL